MVIKNSETNELLLNSIKIPEDPTLLAKMLYEIAEDRRDAYVKDVQENGQLSVEEANNFIVDYLSKKHKYEKITDELLDKKRIIECLRIVCCNELGIDPESVPFYLGDGENDSAILSSIFASTIDFSCFKFNKDKICSLIAINMNFFVSANAVDLIKVVAHEFGHVSQIVLNKNKKSYYNADPQKTVEKSSRLFDLQWAASPNEKDADSYAYGKLTHFMVQAAKKGELNGVIFTNVLKTLTKMTESSIRHFVASVWFVAYKSKKIKSMKREYKNSDIERI